MDDVIGEYLKELFSTEPYKLTEDETKLAQKDLVAFLLQKLSRKRFRKQKMHADTIAEFQQKIASRVEGRRPLYFTIPFGGYKHFWNASYPEPDWAEIFTLRFLTEWLMPIAAAYEPGAVIEFISEDLILPRMNNYPKEAIEKYNEAFTSLLKTYYKNLPENIKFTFFRVGDRFDSKAIIDEVEKLLPERWKGWDELNDEEKEIELKRSKRSVMWQGDVDLTGLAEAEKEKRTIESRLIELAYYDVEAYPQFLGDYFVEDDRIGICFSFGLSPDNVFNWISMGSTYASVVDFWIGRGVLERTEDGFVRRIVSKQQYEKIKDKLQKYELKFDELSFNFQAVETIDSKDWESSIR